MERIINIAAYPDHLKNAVVVIGNFDGVHRGHCALLTRAKQLAKDKGVPCGVLTFEPHPRRLFRPDEPPARITPMDLKAEKLAEAGMDFVVPLDFNWDLASKSADYFVNDILKTALSATHIVVGYNFRFGQLRKGCPETIKSAGFDVTIIDEVQYDNGEKLSSSVVRNALRQGDVVKANAVLGWEWQIRGEVIKGDQRGRELGYPTANLKLAETIHPSYGIYAAAVQIEGEDIWHGSAVNIGIRPMFEVSIAQVEAFIFDFDRDIYGKNLHVKLIKRLRGEAKFNSLGDLISQIELDCAQAKEVLIQYDNANS